MPSIYFPLSSRLIYILENDYYFTRPVVCGKTTFFRRLFDDEKKSLFVELLSSSNNS
jgi:hypothetical protein